MSEERCPSCGGTRSGGLCPNCTLAAALDPESGAEPTPRRIGGYRLFDEIARGGNGVVYRAWQADLKREVALKMLLSTRSDQPDALARFRREAELMASLDDPGILPVYEVGEEAGTPYFSMKLAGGGNLTGRIAALRGKYTDIARLLVRVARAVARAHANGVLHRDLKPSNIVFDAEDRPLVTDFGLARHLGANSSLTGIDALIGTPRYVAPEVVTSPGAKLTTAVDVYGLGAILYELLAGRAPFADLEPLQVLQQVATVAPVRPRAFDASIPIGLEAICLRCLEKRPGDRYAGADEFAQALDSWLEPGTRSPSRWRTMLPSRRRRIARVAALALFVGLGAASAWYALREPVTVPDPAVAMRTLAVVPADPARANAAIDAAVRELSRRLESTQPLAVVPAGTVLAVARSKDFPARAVLRGPLLGAFVQVKVGATSDGKLLVRAGDGLREEELWSERVSPHAMDATTAALATALKAKRTIAPPEARLPRAALAAIVNGTELFLRSDRVANDQAITSFKRAIALAPDSANAHTRLAEAYEQRATRYSDSAVWLDSAIEEASRAIRLDPTLGYAQDTLGLAYYYKGWFKRATAAYEHARSLGAAGNNLAMVYYQLGRYDEAYALGAAQVEDMGPTFADDYESAMILFTLGATDAGERLMRRALAFETRTDKRDREAEAEIALFRGDYQRCRALAEPLDPLLVSSGFYSADEVATECAVRQGDYAGALKNLMPEIQRNAHGMADAGSGGPMLERAILLRLLGREEEAAPVLEAARQAAQAAIDGGSEYWKNWRRLAAVQRLRGEVEAAYRSLDAAFAHGMRINPRNDGDLAFLPFKDDARFAQLRNEQAAELSAMRERVLAQLDAARL